MMWRVWGRIDRRLESWGSKPHIVHRTVYLLVSVFVVCASVLPLNPEGWAP